MSLHTAQEILRRPGKAMPLGEPLYRKTGQVRLSSPIREVSGSFKREWVYSTRKNGTCVVRPYAKLADPRTDLQVDGRQRFGAAQRNWSRISPENRAAWAAWALRHVYREGSGPRGVQAGYLSYVAVQTYRQAMGNGLAEEAPTTSPPPPVLEILQEAPPEEEAFAFRVRHGLKNVEGLRLLVELTPATPTLRRRPEEEDLVWFTSSTQEAFIPLQADGTTYVLHGARYSVVSGKRFGVRMRLVTEEGVAGTPVSGDLIKAAPGEGTPPAEPLPVEAPGTAQTLSRSDVSLSGERSCFSGDNGFLICKGTAHASRLVTHQSPDSRACCRSRSDPSCADPCSPFRGAPGPGFLHFPRRC